MRKRICLLLAVSAVVLLIVPSTVPAAVISIGDPYPAGSWGQRFNETGVGNFDKMEIFSLTGAGFDGNGFQNFSAAGWTGSTSGAAAIATGPDSTNLSFDIHFADANSSTPLSFLFFAFNGSTQLEGALASWTGRSWNITAYNGSAPVPEPGTMMLLGSGLVGLAGWGRKKLGK